MPAGTTSREVCAESGMLATDACPNVTTESFDEHAEPAEYCTIHRGKPLQPPQTAPEVATPARQAPTLRDLDQKGRGKEKIHT